MLDKGVAELHAYDLSPGMIAKAQEKVNKMTPEDAAKVRLSSDEGPETYPAEYFDCVSSLQVVQNLTPGDPEEALGARADYLEELFRILKPGGICAITTRYRLQRALKMPTFQPSTYG